MKRSLRSPSVCRRLRAVLRPLALLTLACSGLFSVSCATSSFAPSTDPEGFTARYSKLDEVETRKGSVLLTRPSTDFSRYTSIQIKPIEFSEDIDATKKKKVTKEEREEIAAYFETALAETLGPDFKIVDYPGSRTIVARLTITEMESSSPILDAFTSAWPSALALSQVKKIATGRHSFVGMATIEVDLRDSQSGRQLLAAQITRAGSKDWEEKFDRWQDVRAAADFVAADIRERLLTLGREEDTQLAMN